MLYAVSRAGANLGIRPADAAVSIEYGQLDVADSSSVSTLAARVKKDQGGCDVLINNAGLYHYTQNATTEQRREMIDINYRGTLRVDEPLGLCGLVLVHWSRECRLCAAES